MEKEKHKHDGELEKINSLMQLTEQIEKEGRRIHSIYVQ